MKSDIAKVALLLGMVIANNAQADIKTLPGVQRMVVGTSLMMIWPAALVL